MKYQNQANKFTFGLGLVLFTLTGGIMIIYGVEMKLILFFALGIYDIWKHGYSKDTSDWEIKPTYFVVASCVLLICVFLFSKSRVDAEDQRGERLNINNAYFEQLSKIKDSLPIGYDNGDSLILITVNDDNNIEFIYKLKSNVNEFDSISKKYFIENNRNNSLQEIAISNVVGINFKYIYLDSNNNLITNIFIHSGEY